MTRAAAAQPSPLRKLGSSDLQVHRICLGTMTWGKQNTEAEAHEQLSYAVEQRGINFIDTAGASSCAAAARVRLKQL
jgi:diketogulonate reductase-like aldo/keto reductase